jgi:hypothetical protein
MRTNQEQWRALHNQKGRAAFNGRAPPLPQKAATGRLIWI